MRLREEMVLIDKKIVTPQLSYCIYNKEHNVYNIKFKNATRYLSYSPYRVVYLNKPIKINCNSIKIFFNGKELTNIIDITRFDHLNEHYYHICFSNGSEKDYLGSELNILESTASDNELKNVFNYLKEIANAISITTNSGMNLLNEQYKKMDFIDKSSALSNYLNENKRNLKYNDTTTLIFPFGCNSSQYKAVRNAIENQISVIEGPPGTGKTQTILNIVANLLIRNKTCQIVSNNNSAIENVEEKLKKYNLDFFVALLGSNANKDEFIVNQKAIPSTILQDTENYDFITLKNEINRLSEIAQTIYNNKIVLGKLNQEINDIRIEYNHFKKYIKDNKIDITKLKNNNIKKINKIYSEIYINPNVNFFRKIKYVLFNKVGNFKFYKNEIKNILSSLQNNIYGSKINELNNDINELNKYIDNNKKYEEDYIKYSMLYLKKILLKKYKNGRKEYSITQIKGNYTGFLSDYPVILSTTYSSRNSFNPDVKFDYIIMDEASQIDIATGALALSSATNAVIIGDDKQLPNVVTEEERNKTDLIFEKYDIDEGYCYSENSFLNSIKLIINDLPITLLKEHYRCHYDIINFCNKKFYDNELVIMTNFKNNDAIKVIRTNIGNHSREHASERQVEIIKELIPNIKYKDIGIIAPYNNQVKNIKNELPNIEVNTIHKYQGREKDVIIISTVDDKISDFVDDPHILNVAISRAKKQLYFIVTGNNIDNTNIKDFIDYVDYKNLEIKDSKIYSVFDYLYEQYTEQRLNFLRKYKKISEYDSENLMYGLIGETLTDYDNLSVACHTPMNMIIKDMSLLNEEEIKYASNYLTHVDFLIYNKLTKKILLAIEVDGYNYHKEGTIQGNRDELKNTILKKYNLPLIRFKTNGSREKEKLINQLDEICKEKLV